MACSQSRPAAAFLATGFLTGISLLAGLPLNPVLPAASGAFSPHALLRPGAPAMPEPPAASLLVDYYETFLRDHDIEAFQRRVLARYAEGTLARALQMGDIQERRAAVLALGLVGGYQVNQAVGRALRDPDPAVRSLADNALWAIWFRADSPENNETLEQVRTLITRKRPDLATELATRLITRSPRFAEAYNQRAIALFMMEKFDESAADCRRVLELNPYHFGALGGLGQCYLRLNLRREALKTYRRALKLQPYSEGLREFVSTLEAEDP
jgi:tetratricopeptide (TPR) repeat protein